MEQTLLNSRGVEVCTTGVFKAPLLSIQNLRKQRTEQETKFIGARSAPIAGLQGGAFFLHSVTGPHLLK